ncbi:integrase arm-type DNA-binding domain-containing protein [uncultured Spongiibacter sp.]|uniref:tyrosine-type recombinase/integrase n=1 Tax=uncultured Spongiibacter sp. TaxID=870896 RepID=UPI0025929CDF|nr:integrase arm-type DNA-binding domain-containing protein [uncultured Spongiibacter sp.]
MPLTATEVKQAKSAEKPYKLADSGGLYLLVNAKGAKYWRYKYRYAGKEKTLALGVYPEVSLKQARQKHQEARDKLAQGIDPGEVRKVEKLTRHLAAAESFEAVGREWFNQLMPDKSKSYRERTGRILEKDLYPVLGNRPIAAITAPELLAALRRIEARGAVDIAHRAKQTSGQIFRYAIVTGRAERDPSGDLTGALKSRRKSHHAAITDPKEVGRLLVAIDGFQGTLIVQTALKLSPLLFQRPGEIRNMEWAEIDWEEGRWELPAEKMKMKLPHIVPLSRQAQELLKNLKPLTGKGRYVFPSARGRSRALSENGVRSALRTIGYTNEQMTPHGFRAMARTILDEVLEFRVDWIEHQLAHAVKDPNGRAYNRTAHLEGRAQMMQRWADYLDQLRQGAEKGNVVVGNFRPV